MDWFQRLFVLAVRRNSELRHGLKKDDVMKLLLELRIDDVVSSISYDDYGKEVEMFGELLKSETIDALIEHFRKHFYGTKFEKILLSYISNLDSLLESYQFDEGRIERLDLVSYEKEYYFDRHENFFH